MLLSESPRLLLPKLFTVLNEVPRLLIDVSKLLILGTDRLAKVGVETGPVKPVLKEPVLNDEVAMPDPRIWLVKPELPNDDALKVVVVFGT